MENWNDLRICLALHRFGTMSAAASYLGANVATVSRRIHKLSEQMDQPLFTKKGVIWTATPFAMHFISWAEQTEWRLADLVGKENSDVTSVTVRLDETTRGSVAMSGISALASERGDMNVTFTTLEGPSRGADMQCALSCNILEDMDLLQVPIGHVRRAVWCGANFQNDLRGWIKVGCAHREERLNAALHQAFGAPSITTDDIYGVLDIVRKSPLVAVLPVDLALSQRGLRSVESFPVIEDEVYLYLPKTREHQQLGQELIAATRKSLRADDDALAQPRMPLAVVG